MKKTYMQPAMAIDNMELEDMIAASLENGFNLTDLLETDATSGNLSRESEWLLDLSMKLE